MTRPLKEAALACNEAPASSYLCIDDTGTGYKDGQLLRPLNVHQQMHRVQMFHAHDNCIRQRGVGTAHCVLCSHRDPGEIVSTIYRVPGYICCAMPVHLVVSVVLLPGFSQDLICCHT